MITGALRRQARRLQLSALYLPLVLRDYVRPVRDPHLRLALYHFVFNAERARFEEHLRYFKDHYDMLSLDEALRRLRSRSLSGPALTLTFDDGYKNNRTNAAELLAKHGLEACFYVTTDFVSLPARDRGALAAVCRDRFRLRHPVENLDWDDLRWLAHAGHEIGSHTVTHAVLSRCGRDEAVREVVESKRVIERELGRAVRHFAVPYGRPDHCSAETARIVREAGYESCALTIGGPNLPGCDLLLRRDDLSASFPLWEVRTRLLRTARSSSPVALVDGA